MIYIDEVVIINFCIDYFILNLVSKILKLNTKNKNIMLSSLFGEISLLYLFINMNEIAFLLFKTLIIIIMSLIAYKYNDIKSTIKNIVYFYIVSFFLGGTLYYLKFQNNIKIFYIILITPVVLNIFKYFTYNLKEIQKTRYKVSIYLNNGKILYLNGFMDTGNSLIDPYSNKKVIIINKQVNENYFLIPYKTINNSSLLKCFKPKKVYIDGIGERKDIVIGVINKKFSGYNCLLNYKLMEEK